MTDPASPSHVELGVPDVARAHAFYGSVLGWPPIPDSGMDQVETATLPIGIHGGDPNAHFEVFFTVPSLEAALDAVRAGGGTVVSAITDAGPFGRYAECADDQGVAFGLRQLISGADPAD